ncbi:MAG: hypothetical protein PHH04_08515 [Thomasclavelia sp.]|nr:hypothetical protein [Thomasclavelia sp.]
MKLKVNTIAGILDIIGAVLYAFAIFVILGSAFSTDTSTTEGVSTFFLVYAVVSVVVHIYGLVKSKQNNMPIAGHVLGIIEHGIYAALGALLGIVAMILVIIAAVFTLKDNKVPMQNQTSNA